MFQTWSTCLSSNYTNTTPTALNCWVSDQSTTLHYSDVIMGVWRLKSPASRLFTQLNIQGADQRKQQTSHLSVYIRRNPYFNHFLRGISVFGYYPYFSVFCINCRLINRNPQLKLYSWTVPRTHAWAGTIVRPLPGELRPRGPIHVTPLGSIITNTATPLRNIESAQCRMRRHRIPV